VKLNCGQGGKGALATAPNYPQSTNHQVPEQTLVTMAQLPLFSSCFLAETFIWGIYSGVTHHNTSCQHKITVHILVHGVMEMLEWHMPIK